MYTLALNTVDRTLSVANFGPSLEMYVDAAPMLLARAAVNMPIDWQIELTPNGVHSSSKDPLPCDRVRSAYCWRLMIAN